MADDTVTLQISGPDGDDEVTLSAALVEMLAEGDEHAAEVVGDLALFGCAQRAHASVHHGQGEAPQELQDAESVTMELFEERFGASYAELTGHQH